MECQICCDKFNKSSHNKIKCRYCEYSFCKECGKKYVSCLKLNEEFNCMNCHHQWTFEDLISMFPRNFIDTKVKEKQQDMYFEYDKTFLPRTQQIIEIEKELEDLRKIFGFINKRYKMNGYYSKQFMTMIIEMIRIRNNDIEKLILKDKSDFIDVETRFKQKIDTFYNSVKNDLKSLTINQIDIQQLMSLYNDVYHKSMVVAENTYKWLTDAKNNNDKHKYLNVIKDAYNQATNKILNQFVTQQQSIRSRQNRLHNRVDVMYHDNETLKTETETEVVLGSCPQTDCHGFIDKKYTCGLCHVHVCVHCMKTKNENHECNADDVASVKMIREECKKCPTCKAFVFKISGCYQMWCVNCHTPFDWTSGKKLDMRNFHNPELDAWQRTHQRQNGVQCIPINKILDDARLRIGLRPPFFLSDFNVLLVHCFFWNRFLNPVFHRESNTWAVRKMYLQNEINEQEYKRKLFMNTKHQNMTHEITNIQRCYENALCDLYANYLLNQNQDAFQTELENLRVYINGESQRVNKIYKRNVDNIIPVDFKLPGGNNIKVDPREGGQGYITIEQHEIHPNFPGATDAEINALFEDPAKDQLPRDSRDPSDQNSTDPKRPTEVYFVQTPQDEDVIKILRASAPVSGESSSSASGECSSSSANLKI